VALSLTPGVQSQLLEGYRGEAAALPREAGRATPTLRDAVAASRRRTRFPG
jgi:hypothetical protein